MREYHCCFHVGFVACVKIKAGLSERRSAFLTKDRASLGASPLDFQRLNVYKIVTSDHHVSEVRPLASFAKPLEAFYGFRAQRFGRVVRPRITFWSASTQRGGYSRDYQLL
jgi:hypothetical protein